MELIRQSDPEDSRLGSRVVSWASTAKPVEAEESFADALTIDPEPSSQHSRGLLVYFEDVTYYVQTKAGRGQKLTILDGLQGFFEPGKMTAVLGHSGSGKTTLLDVLAGRKTSGTLTGTIQYNGMPPSSSLLRRVTGYVEQFDTLVDSLTCREMLLYTAQLKRLRSEPLADKQAAVEHLLDKLGLSSCSSTQIGHALKRGISGGQAKRLNIGVALITDPRVLYLDEPTSGLDSFTAYEVMRVVAGLTSEGTTVATTIHSPSAACFNLFDRLLVLVNGRVVYHGGAGDTAITYFTTCCGARQPQVGDNLAEWMLEAVTQADRSNEGKLGLADVYASSFQAKVNSYQYTALMEETTRRHSVVAELRPFTRDDSSFISNAGSLFASSSIVGVSSSSSMSSAQKCRGCWGSETYVTPAWWSLWVLLQYRTARNYCSPAYTLPRVLEKVLFAVVVLSLYWNTGTDFSTLNVPVLSSLLFLMVLSPICSAMIYLPGMGMERALFIRERNDGLYRPITYLVYKMLDDLLLMLPVTSATTATVFLACRLQGSFLLFWLVNFVTLANGTALAYTLAALSPGVMVAMPLLSFILILSLILCGFMIRAPAVPVYWSWAVKCNVVHYSWGALMINQYQGQEAQLGGLTVLSYFGLANREAWRCLQVVVSFFCMWSFMAWLALAYVRIYKR